MSDGGHAKTTQAAAAPLAIETRGLTKRFGPITAVDAVDLAVRSGEIFGCLGPNGSGKSTLMRMLLGLVEPSAGEVAVLGRAIPREVETLRTAVGYMTQRFSLYEDLSVEENLHFAAEIFGLGRRRRHLRVAALVDEFGLGPYRRLWAGALSGGWKQRVALAAAIVHEPALLVLDEPTAGIDPQSRRVFWEKLFQLAGGGATIFVSTHYMDEAVRCHRLCMLREGRRAAVGTPRDLTQALEGRVVDVRVAEPETAIAALGRLPLVASTTQLGDTVHVLLAPGAGAPLDASRALQSFLVSEGLYDVTAAPAKANLEDVFVALLQAEVPNAAAGPEGGA
jgi:ABC-2 type transport system ATP-binding protein